MNFLGKLLLIITIFFFALGANANPNFEFQAPKEGSAVYSIQKADNAISKKGLGEESFAVVQSNQNILTSRRNNSQSADNNENLALFTQKQFNSLISYIYKKSRLYFDFNNKLEKLAFQIQPNAP